MSSLNLKETSTINIRFKYGHDFENLKYLKMFLNVKENWFLVVTVFLNGYGEYVKESTTTAGFKMSAQGY